MAAMEAFEELGYEKTSMDYVSEVADASKRTLYNHFSSKEVLFTAVVNSLLEEAFLLRRIPYDPKRSLDDQLNEFAESKMIMVQKPDRLKLMRVILGVFISHPHIAQKTFEKVAMQDDGLEIWLQSAKKDGRLDFKDAKITAELFWSLISGRFFWCAIMEGPMEKTQTKLLKDEMIQTFLARYKS